MPRWTSAFAILLAIGCAPQEESLIYLHAPAWQDGACGVDPESDVYLPEGYLDLDPIPGFRNEYMLPGVILNNMPASGMGTSTGIEDNEVQLLDAQVRLAFVQPELTEAASSVDEGLMQFTVTQPTNSISPGERHAVLVKVIHQTTAEALRPIISGVSSTGYVEINAHVVMRAKRTGSSTRVGIIEAREFLFPIMLCNGCALSCRDCPNYECPPNVTAWAGGVCGNAQDAPIQPAACLDPEGTTG